MARSNIGAVIITDLDHVSTEEFSTTTGWELKPEGLCRGEVCVPAPGAQRADGTVDIPVVAERMGMPLEHDPNHGLWALGPGTSTGRVLSSAVAADPELMDRSGRPFRLSALRGRKIVLVGWASY